MHHSSTSIYVPNFIEIGQTFCGRTYGGTDGRTDVPTDGRTFPPLLFIGRLGGVDLKIKVVKIKLRKRKKGRVNKKRRTFLHLLYDVIYQLRLIIYLTNYS